MENPYEVPEASARIWRYMDFAKFVSLLKDRALFFARADHLGDPFEGAIGLQANEAAWNAYSFYHHRSNMESSARVMQPEWIMFLPGTGQQLKAEHSAEEAEEFFQLSFDQWKSQAQALRQRQFVNCWHESEHESEAQWRIYCQPGSAGVSICSTYSLLQSSLDVNLDVKIGRVQYVDFTKTYNTSDNAIFRKRQSLNYEKEVRAVTWGAHDKAATELGIKCPVELERLIEKIVISPFAALWFKDVVEETLRRFAISATVTTSEISALPFY